MTKTTPATLALKAAGIGFELHEYDYDPDAEKIGLQAAESLGVSPSLVLKTLIVRVDARPCCVVLPSDREASMKKLAAAFGGKVAEMCKPTDAERITGYRIGGVSPFGQKKRLATVVDAAALDHPAVFVNGGRRGLQLKLNPAQLVAALGASTASITAQD